VALLIRPAMLSRYLSVIVVALPIWFIIAVIVTFSPELGRALGLEVAPVAGKAVLFYYLGITLGDLTTGYLSHRIGSRKRVIGIFLGITGTAGAGYFVFAGHSLATYYGMCFALGWASGYWAVFITLSAELFGTNLRATVATTAPNFVRGLAMPLALAFRTLGPVWGLPTTAALLGTVTIVLAALALRQLDETHGRDLDFVESA
jgi:MFS family permease